MNNIQDLEIWTDISGLPKRGKNIDWANSIGYQIPFKYNYIEGYLNITGYIREKSKYSYVYITVKDYAEDPVKIKVSSIAYAQLSNIFYNRIIDKFPEIIPYLVNKSDAYKYAYQSNKKVLVRCPYCHREFKRIVSNLYQKGFRCECCNDGVSIPNKIMANILNQLQIDYKREVGQSVFSWIGPYYYDFYFKTQSDNILLEMDGRYHSDTGCMKRDIIKNQLANDNNFKLIRIDCKYSGDPVEYIKYNIINSELSNILNLDSIDWEQCKNAYKNKIMIDVCQLWESTKLDISAISKVYKMDNRTIAKYLKRGVILGLCPSYSYAEAHSRSSSRQIAIVDNKQIMRVFFNAKECAEILKEETNINFTQKGVYNCAYGYNKTYHGLQFQHISREQYLQYKMIE